MACRTESKTIGEQEYSVTQWPAEKALLMKFRLVKAFGAPLAVLMGKGDESEEDETQALSKGLAMMFQNNSPEELVALMKACVVGVALDGKRVTESSFNELFSGDDLSNIYKVFIFVLQVNYSNLFKGQSAERLLAKVADSV